MAKNTLEQFTFNRGIIDALAEARRDVKRVGMSASTMENWMPSSLGPMSLRAGTYHRGETYTNAATRMLPFVFSVDDTAIVEITPGAMRVWKDNAVITRPSVSSAVTDGDFTLVGSLASWDLTVSEAPGLYPVWKTGGYMSMTGDSTLFSAAEQQVTVAAGDQGVVHALEIVIQRGDCVISVGSTTGDDDYVAEATLYPGRHSLAFTPTGNFFVRLRNLEDYPCYVDSIDVASAGDMVLTTLWPTAASVENVRAEQSGDIIFVASEGILQQQIERRPNDSWSVVSYLPYDGPFRSLNPKITHKLTPGALSGASTLASNIAFFESGHVGALFRLESVGQNVSSALGADGFTDPIRVTSTGTDRAFTYTVSGLTVDTITLQRSVGAIGAWTDVLTRTTDTVGISYNDTFDNQIIYYRIGYKTGAYTTDTATVGLNYAVGSIDGVCRVTGFTNNKLVDIEITTHMGATSATENWFEGAWSPKRGYPSAVALHGARLWWAGKDNLWASIVDSYSSFDDNYLGDAGPISRSIGSGPVDTINWLLSVENVIAGAEAAEWVVKSSSLDEPITPTNFSLKAKSTFGSAKPQGIQVDHRGLFIDGSGGRLREVDNEDGGYRIKDLNILTPSLFSNATRIAVQRRPDTRIHIVSGGNAYILVNNPAEEINCWTLFTTGDSTTEIEDVVILPSLPGESEDHVYYVVKRVIDSATVRYLEELARADDALGSTVNVLTDSSIIYSGASTATITGLSPLEGESVVVWANGADQGVFTVSGGAITLNAATTYAVVGLYYAATFIGSKLVDNVEGLTKTGRISDLGLILANTHAQGLQYGTDAAYLDELPLIEEGVAVDGDAIHTRYDKESIEINGSFDTDSRLVLKAGSPKPCTVMAVIISGTLT